MPMVTTAVSAASRGWKLRNPLRATVSRFCMERRISALVKAAMAKSRYSARKRKKFELEERMAAASSSRNAIMAMKK